MSVAKREQGWTGLKALLTHSAIHALGTLVVLVVFAMVFSLNSVSFALGVILADLILHFIIDKGKIIVEGLTAIEYKTTKWWLLLSLDQTLHFICYLVYILLI